MVLYKEIDLGKGERYIDMFTSGIHVYPDYFELERPVDEDYLKHIEHVFDKKLDASKMGYAKWDMRKDYITIEDGGGKKHKIYDPKDPDFVKGFARNCLFDDTLVGLGGGLSDIQNEYPKQPKKPKRNLVKTIFTCIILGSAAVLGYNAATNVQSNNVNELIDKVSFDANIGTLGTVMPQDELIVEKCEQILSKCQNKTNYDCVLDEVWNYMGSIGYCKQKETEIQLDPKTTYIKATKTPREVLEQGCGSCSDQSETMVSLLRSCGFAPEDVFVLGMDINHAIVGVRKNNKWLVYDPTTSPIALPIYFDFVSAYNDKYAVNKHRALSKNETHTLEIDNCKDMKLLNSSMLPLVEEINQTDENSYKIKVKIPEDAAGLYELSMNCSIDEKNRLLSQTKRFTTYKEDEKIG